MPTPPRAGPFGSLRLVEALGRLEPRSGRRRLVDVRLERGAHDLARLLERAELPERDRLRRRRLPTAVASTGPASTGRPAASAVQRHSGRLSAPPPTMWISGGREPVTLGEQRTVWACFSARLSRMQRTISPGSPGSGWPVSAQNARMRPGRSPGREEARVVGLDERRERRRSLGRGDRAPRTSTSGPPQPNALRHSCSSHRPSTFRSSRDGAAHAALVGEVRGERLVGDQRLGELDADERPRAGADVGGTWDRGTAPRRPPRPCRACRGTATARARGRVRSATSSRRAPRTVAGRTTSRKAPPGCRAARAGRSPTPARAGRGTGWSSRSCTRTTATPLSQKWSRSGISSSDPAASSARPPAATSGEELEERVDRHQLDAGALVDLARRDRRRRALHHALGPPVAVVHRVAETSAPSRSSSPKSTPHVSMPTESTSSGDASRGGQALEHLLVQPQHVPVEAPAGSRPERSGSGAPPRPRGARRRAGRRRPDRSARRCRPRPSSSRAVASDAHGGCALDRSIGRTVATSGPSSDRRR